MKSKRKADPKEKEQGKKAETNKNATKESDPKEQGMTPDYNPQSASAYQNDPNKSPSYAPTTPEDPLQSPSYSPTSPFYNSTGSPSYCYSPTTKKPKYSP